MNVSETIQNSEEQPLALSFWLTPSKNRLHPALPLWTCYSIVKELLGHKLLPGRPGATQKSGYNGISMFVNDYFI
jgi:hypothetical protein